MKRFLLEQSRRFLFLMIQSRSFELAVVVFVVVVSTVVDGVVDFD